ncbi:MAG: Dabb family protein [Acidimicrobiia bacterium]|nr:Dabb family protein [Acidimicrobiia bacterium]
MLRHVSLLTWTPEATAEQRQAVRDALGRLPGRIPEIRDYRFGDDAGLADGNADFAVVADFDSPEAYDAYARHPDHQAVIADHIRPILAGRLAVQFVVHDGA